MGILIYRAEAIRNGIPVEKSVLFPFSFLFGLQSVLVLYWVQDLVDFGGHKNYTMRKKFNFKLQDTTAASDANDDADPNQLEEHPLVQM